MAIPQLLELLDKIKAIHEKKGADYTQVGSPFENFERSAALASWFDSQEDKAFIVLIGTKLARLATLLNSKKEPNNESIEDSFLDLTTYCALWASYHADKKQEHQYDAVKSESTKLIIVLICPYCNIRRRFVSNPEKLYSCSCGKTFTAL